MEPTLELTLQPPAVGTDPLAALLITVAAVWIFGGPWLRLCWWLGARTRRSHVLEPAPTLPSSHDIVPCSAMRGSNVERAVRLALLIVALGAGLGATRRPRPG